MKNKNLYEKYAEILIKKGVNIQKKQNLVINSSIKTADFAKLCAKKAYEQGAGRVFLNWSDDELYAMDLEYADIDNLLNIREWLFLKQKTLYEENSCFLHILSSDPEALKNVDSQKLASVTKAFAKKFSSLQKYTMNDICSWCIVAYPTIEWATRVFPNEKEDVALNKLEDAIFRTNRMLEENPFKAWEEHLDNLTNKAQKLNDLQLDKLIYKSSNGTNLEVGLADEHIWMAATSKNAQGIPFVPNLPTEEVFTAPHKTKINGTLVSTKPLSHNGNIIDNFKFEFKDGKVVNYSAETGEETLKSILEQDKDAKFLGEIALVPYDSPISQSNILFFNTLFDENASCHFALGACYPTCIKNGVNLSKEELLKKGGNSSTVHVDFMVGNFDLNIMGITKSGEKVQIFKNGNWTI